LEIEAHVTHTYHFLKRIPWTKHLKGVPAIAYGHHEKLDGSGYPQGLKQEDIPVQSQILTIADIYDALTASDRPYKRRLPVNTVLHILRQEAAKNKINSDLVELFEQRQVFTVLGHTLPVDVHSVA
jgi:HD-GYP domain-containing protein (c-di-GMP phosphodiesterase class II)